REQWWVLHSTTDDTAPGSFAGWPESDRGAGPQWLPDSIHGRFQQWPRLWHGAPYNGPGHQSPGSPTHQQASPPAQPRYPQLLQTVPPPVWADHSPRPGHRLFPKPGYPPGPPRIEPLPTAEPSHG